MKFCQPHWDALRGEIERRGLSRLVAKGGTAAAERMAREIEGTAGPDDFDPLMAAHNLILNNAMDVCKRAGASPLVLMMPNEDGSDRCPLCFLNERHKEGCEIADCTFSYDDWIQRAAADAERIARATVLADGPPGGSQQ